MSIGGKRGVSPGGERVAFDDLFPPAFMKHYTDYVSIRAMGEAWGKDIPMNVSFIEYCDEDWEKLVKQKTQFINWEEMKSRASAEWLAKRQQAPWERKATKARELAAKASHFEARQAEVEALNTALEETYAAIDGLLATTLDVDHYFDLRTLCRELEHPPFEQTELERPTQKPILIQDPTEPVYEEPEPPRALFGKKKKYEAAIAAAQSAHALARAEWHSKLEEAAARRKTLQEEFEQVEVKRLALLEKEKARYAEECIAREQRIAEHNANIDSFISNLGYGASDAVEEYISIVFSHSHYPNHFPVSHEVKFDPSTAELHLRVLIPPPSEMETIKVYRYVKKNDEIASTDLSQKARKDRYASSIQQVVLRSIHEIFEADRRGLIKTVSLEAGTETTDPATGKMGFIPFAAVAAKREVFLEINLSAVVPKSTLDLLGAAVSKNPYELIATDTTGVRRS